MPRFEVRLESPDLTKPDGDPHFRVTRLVAEDQAAAAALCRRKEFETCAWQMEPAELERVEEIEADPDQPLVSTDKGRLFAHRQAEPYEVVSVTEIEDR